MQNILVALSGPINAVIRYGITALGAWLVSRGYASEELSTQIMGAILAVIPAIIGALIDTKDAKIAQVADLQEVRAVEKTSGERVTSP